MTELPELRAAVKAAAERCARPAAAPARRRRVIFKAGALAFGAALLTGSALAASGVWRPQVGDENREQPTISASSVPAAQAEHFAVLRRPASDADHGEKVRYALRFLSGENFQGVRTDAVRLLSMAGRGYVLVPSTRAVGKDDALCVFAIQKEGGGLSCWTTAEILEHKSLLMTIEPPEHTAAERAAIAKQLRDSFRGGGTAILPQQMLGGTPTIFGLVPDGVATVEFTDGSSMQRAKVVNNFFVVTLASRTPSTPEPNLSPENVRWLDSGGKEIAK